MRHARCIRTSRIRLIPRHDVAVNLSARPLGYGGTQRINRQAIFHEEEARPDVAPVGPFLLASEVQAES